ncbi:TPA: hypothetical protein L3M66_004291 [Vibrio parahaemolyticus]|uniref:hypothetical protein n=1 Tax=Vibrio parahaemolyticus TaxID=670 RepID=UPI003B67801B|nr:hypothetical protein [Vibrio parahaemolyticus]
MTTIKDANLNLPVELWGHQNDGYCSSPINKNTKYVMDSVTAKLFIDELAQLNQLSLIEESLQCVSKLLDGTPVLTAFPTLDQYKAVSKRMKTIPQELKEEIEQWEALGANEIVIDFIRNQ